MKNNITRSKIKTIGKKLRVTSPTEILSSDHLNTLNQWREHHTSSLKYYANLLKREARKLNFNSQEITITQRIKRIHSIILKLKRFPNMQLSMMDDIAGLRIVLESNNDVFKLINILKEKQSKHHLIKLNNYISHPKEDGYRSIHAIYQIKKTPTIQIELQLRSSLQHCWATGVEVFGTLEKTSFKTGHGSEQWKEFFTLLSSRFAIKENSPVLAAHEIYSLNQLESKLIAMIRQLNIIEQLNAYTSTYSNTWRQNRAKGRSGKYALLTLNTDLATTDVDIFAESKLSEALEKYAATEKKYHSSDVINIVLVNLDNVENLERAYPNYFMDTKILSNCLSRIVLGEF